MNNYKEQFIKFCLDHKVLSFGNFILKSGRTSHYFFNAGLFSTNTAIAKLGEYYAELIYKNNVKFDCLFGPAYKGIPLAVTTSIALAKNYNLEISLAFNRKETKTHGEGGNIIGADLKNKNILLIDDVISAGTATKETIELLSNYPVNIIGVVIALDRKMEAHKNNYKTASEEITGEYNIPVYSLVNIDDIIAFTKNNQEYSEISKLF
ncbi:MAG: orotate phosphoribosyltransferase [Gammaproteobacteria bacterium]|nr:orotate phosphoribosyltransferase [Gammaproteobacteria bacterium]